MLGVKPSYATGFAQWPGMSEYPGLWNGLVGAWDASLGATGNKVFDLSGNGNTGTFVSAMSWVPGDSGPALNFPGGNDYVSILDSPSLRCPTTVSVFARFRTTHATNIQVIFSKNHTDYEVLIDINGNIQAFWGDGAAFETATVANNGRITVNNWHDVCFVIDKSIGRVWFYVDGQFIGTDTDTARTGSGSLIAKIGMRSSSNIFDWYGDISHVYVYNRLLSASEIALLCQLRKRLVT